jgi:tetrahydrodipicolinate N-succinyltransferase
MTESLLRSRHPTMRPEKIMRLYTRKAKAARSREDKSNLWWLVYTAAIWANDRKAEDQAYEESFKNMKVFPKE